MRRVVIILAALAVATAVVYAWRSSARDTSCETTMDFDGVTYAVYEVAEEVPGKDDLGVGVERGCGDSGRWSDDVAVSRIGGVDPRTALITPVAAHVLYVAEGVAIDELPSKVADRVAE